MTATVIVCMIFISSIRNAASIYPHLNPVDSDFQRLPRDKYFNMSPAFELLLDWYSRYASERQWEVVQLSDAVFRPNTREVIDGRTIDILYEGIGCKMKNFSTVVRHRRVLLNYTWTSVGTMVSFRLSTKEMMCKSISFVINGTRYSDSDVYITFEVVQFELLAVFHVIPKCRALFQDLVWTRIEDPSFNLTYKNLYGFLPRLSEFCVVQHVAVDFDKYIEPMMRYYFEHAMLNVDLCKHVDFYKAKKPK